MVLKKRKEAGGFTSSNLTQNHLIDIQTHLLSNPSLLHDLTSQPEYTQDLSPTNAGATNGPQHICQSQHWRCRIEAPCLSSQATQQLCLRVYVLPPWKLTWQWKNHNILNGIYIFIWLFFHCHVSFQGGNWVARMIITRIIMSHDHNDCMKSSWDWSTMDTMQTDANCSKSEDCTMFIQVKHALTFFRNYHDGPTSTSKHPYQYYHHIPYCTPLHNNPRGRSNPSENLPIVTSTLGGAAWPSSEGGKKAQSFLPSKSRFLKRWKIPLQKQGKNILSWLFFLEICNK